MYLRYVEADGIDLVVMGTHGRKGLDRILFGSVAHHVVTTCPVPVMTVNPHRTKR
jgi:nucleotide-binding universal stress UspA family protein